MEPLSIILIGFLLESTHNKTSVQKEEQPLTSHEVAGKVRNLLQEIEQKKYSDRINVSESRIAIDALDRIENDEKFKKQVIEALKELGFSSFKVLVGHPAVSIIIDVLKKFV